MHSSHVVRESFHVKNVLTICCQIRMLARIQELDQDKCTIVKWSCWFMHEGNFCLEFELLHMSLRDFFNGGGRKDLTMGDIRTVLEQVCCTS